MDSGDYIKPLSGIGTQVHTLRAVIGFQIAVLDAAVRYTWWVLPFIWTYAVFN